LRLDGLSILEVGGGSNGEFCPVQPFLYSIDLPFDSPQIFFHESPFRGRIRLPAPSGPVDGPVPSSRPVVMNFSPFDGGYVFVPASFFGRGLLFAVVAGVLLLSHGEGVPNFVSRPMILTEQLSTLPQIGLS